MLYVCTSDQSRDWNRVEDVQNARCVDGCVAHAAEVELVAIKTRVAAESEPMWRSRRDEWIASAAADLNGAIRDYCGAIPNRTPAFIRWLATGDHECV